VIVLLSLPLLTGISWFVLSTDATQWLYILITIILTTSISYLFNKSSTNQSFLLGTLIPLVAWSGENSLHLLVLIYLLVNLRMFKRIPLPFVYFSMVPIVWAVSLIYQQFDLISQYFYGGYGLFKSINMVPPAALRQLEVGVQWYSFSLLTGLLIFDSDKRTSIWAGILKVGLPIALLISGVYGLLWSNGLSAFISFPNQSELWNEIGRPVGVFTDPNSAGIFLFLISLVIYFIAKKNTVSHLNIAVLSTFTIFCGALSGSRTFWLGVVSFFVFNLLVGKTFTLKKIGALLLVISLLSVALVQFGGEINIVGVHRLRQSFLGVLDGDPTTFLSRLYFARIAIAAISDYPLFGMGSPYNFLLLAPAYSFELGIPMGVWSDNPNNFYLGLIVSFGIVGGVIFMLELLRFRASLPLKNFLPGLFSVALVFVFGPHQYFDEVRVLLSLIIASVFTVATTKISVVLKSSIIIAVCLCIFFASHKTELGVYRYEDSQGVFRWSAENFRVYGYCDMSDKINVTIRNGAPHQVTLEMKGLDTDSYVKLDIISGEQKNITLNCQAAESRSQCGEIILGRVTPSWIPALENGDDWRRLGVQILSPNPSLDLQSRRSCLRK
jgi:hypothetical protein